MERRFARADPDQSPGSIPGMGQAAPSPDRSGPERAIVPADVPFANAAPGGTLRYERRPYTDRRSAVRPRRSSGGGRRGACRPSAGRTALRQSDLPASVIRPARDRSRGVKRPRAFDGPDAIRSEARPACKNHRLSSRGGQDAPRSHRGVGRTDRESACALPRRSRHWRVRAVEAACGSTARYREQIGDRSRKSVIFSG